MPDFLSQVSFDLDDASGEQLASFATHEDLAK